MTESSFLNIDSVSSRNTVKTRINYGEIDGIFWIFAFLKLRVTIIPLTFLTT